MVPSSMKGNHRQNECLAGMQGRYGHFFEKCRLWVRHVWYIIVSECQTAPQTAVLHRWLSKDCPNCRYPRKVSALGFFVCSHWKCLSCLPDSSAVFLFNLSRIVSSTHRDTDRLGNSSSWSSSEVGRLKHFGVLRSVNSIWISPMWIVTYSRIYFINRPAWLQVRTKVTNWALANRWKGMTCSKLCPNERIPSWRIDSYLVVFIGIHYW